MKHCTKRNVPKVPKKFLGRSAGAERDRSGWYTFWAAALWDSFDVLFHLQNLL